MKPTPRSVALPVLVVAAALLAAGCNRPTFQPPPPPCAIGERGGQVEEGPGCATDGAVTIEAPAGAVDGKSVEVTITAVPDEGLPEGVIPGTAYAVGPAGETFAQPVRLTIRYAAAAVPGGDAGWLRLVEILPAGDLGGTWRSQVDPAASAVRGEVTHLAVYAVADLSRAGATFAVSSEPQSKADILFMVDNSNSMDPKQQSLKANFQRFMEPLTALDPPLDMHIGIVTSDLGAGQFTPPSCDTVGGDQGALQNVPTGTSCDTAHLNDPADRFLSYAPDRAGGPPVTNFTGDLKDAFACYAAVGTGGCGFEHQLASVRAALEGALELCDPADNCTTNTAQLNAGFVRPDAALAVVLLTDEDDCSAPSYSMLFDPSQTTFQSPLGPLTSYRCFEFGNLCDGRSPGRDPGPRTGCEPGTFQPDQPNYQLTPVEDFAGFLKGLKPDPRMVSLAIIGGPAEPVVVGADSNGYPDLQPACTGAMGTADPAPRLNKLSSLFEQDRATYVSLCGDDLSLAMTAVGQQVQQSRVLAWCLDFTPADIDPAPGTQVDCRVITETLGELPACVARAGETCFQVNDAAGCPGHAALQIKLADAAVRTGTWVSVECATLAPE